STCACKCLDFSNQLQNPIPNMKNGRRIIVDFTLPCFFRASLPGHFPIIKGRMNTKVYQDILQKNLTSSHRKIVVLLQVSDSMFHLFLHPTL
uniref:Uncharacterized protein n=1 Tax=Cyprinus carpio TaxID=7962 RepID=A0A8C1NLC0_CYPCA